MKYQFFQLGDRVIVITNSVNPHDAFVITRAKMRSDGRMFYSGRDEIYYLAGELSMVRSRSGYAPTERRIVSRVSDNGGLSYLNQTCRPETDAEMQSRHAAERAAYEAEPSEQVA